MRRWLGVALRAAGLATRRDVNELRAELGRLNPDAPTLDALRAQIRWLDEARSAQAERIASLERLTALEAVSRFVRQTALSFEPLVSVVLPTFDRPERLRRAIASVVAQRYENWELLVVDDGGSQDSRGVVDAFDDERIAWSRIEHGGACTARNHALRLATGELVAYIDDDNVMDQDWLLAVVWAFQQHPDRDVLYGAFVVDDLSRVGGVGGLGELPRVVLHPFSREGLNQSNLADTGSIAHRAGLREASWDESLREMGDWDLLLRLTANHDPLVLPVVAHYYTTDAPDRLTNGPTHAADLAKILNRMVVSS
ncbi:MAG TPA: glycosyltransferase family A protein [Solirubrobacteraceae bacterium]|nr:glycosyltransferase family A protein [Solirubrobacteraceae bacterium]